MTEGTHPGLANRQKIIDENMDQMYEEYFSHYSKYFESS